MFEGNVKVRTVWIGKRKMRLLSEISFRDSKNKKWIAPKDSVIDGASIPKFFWRFIGSPFVGHYRRASVIHDVYCVIKTRPRKETNRVFYEMMLCDNVPKFKAKLMYWAVQVGAPKW